MKRYAKTVVRTLGIACCWFTVTSAEAATPRAYVSVNGNDLNTCNVPTTPCRTYTGALTQVTAGGEVIVLDSGTFGGGTISQAVTINAPLGVVALAATPIIVNPGAGNEVVLRGLTFQAATPGTGTAITHQSGTLYVENSVVDGWMDGLLSSSTERLFVKESIFRNNANAGVWASGATVSVAVDDSFFEGNGLVGVLLDGGSGRVSNTIMTGNNYGGAAENSQLNFVRCESSGNQRGLAALVNGLVRVSESTVTRNSLYGLSNANVSGTLETFGNNVVRGNATDTFGVITSTTVQ
jgi:hypothetical protein